MYFLFPNKRILFLYCFKRENFLKSVRVYSFFFFFFFGCLKTEYYL